MYGEAIQGYEVGMLNEKEVRAGAGILFFIGIVAFMISLLTSDFYFAKFMIIGFFIDFTIRVINPKYAPSLILARVIVSGQNVKYVGAKQKRFAWVIGVILAIIMLWTMVINDIRGPINFLVCGLCLLLLFFESSFGICLGCKIYNIFDKNQNKYCAGGVCEVHKKEKIQKVNLWQITSIIIFTAMIFLIPYFLRYLKENVVKDCIVPQFAINMGHIEEWKKHNNCL